jgi:hypothetical protein
MGMTFVERGDFLRRRSAHTILQRSHDLVIGEAARIDAHVVIDAAIT